MHGVKRLFSWMIPRFDKERFEVSLLSLRGKDVSVDNLESYGFPVYYLDKGKFDPSTLPALIQILKRLKIDVIQTHGYGATTFGRAASVYLGIPNILHEHANLTDTPWFQKFPDKLFDRYTDLAIAVSESTRKFCIKGRLLSSERVKKVFLGAPLDEYHPFTQSESNNARHGFGFTSDSQFIFGTVTRLHESKGNRYFVEAAEKVLQKIPNAIFSIVGEGPLQRDLQEQAEKLGISERVVFLGFQRDVAACFASFDVVVFPSLWEGTPLTIFESMAMRKPIVSTDVDGLREVLVDGDNAIVVPSKDSEALANGMIRLAQNEVLRERLSERALVTSKRFGLQEFVNLMEHLYEVLFERYGIEGRRPKWDYQNDFDFLDKSS